MFVVGDGAGSVIIESSDHNGIIFSEIGASNEHADILKTSRNGIDDEYLEMSGKFVFKLAVVLALNSFNRSERTFH